MSTETPTFRRRDGVDSAAKAFFYARTPMLLVDRQGVVAELNAACRELLGLDVAGCRGKRFTYLTERLGSKVEGDLVPPNGTTRKYVDSSQGEMADKCHLPLETADLKVCATECSYHSQRLGSVRLRVSDLPYVDTASGTCAGSIVFLEPSDMAGFAALQVSIDRRLGHEVMWEVYAASYDRILGEMPFYQEVLERHCAAMEPEYIRTVLDVGAGSGIPTLRLLNFGKYVTAVEINRAMVEKLYSKLDAKLGDRLTVIEDTAEWLPHLPDASFDGVSVLLAFFDMDDPASALREAQRLLKPGGTLIITEPRACFNVDELMAAAEESLRAQGLKEDLAADWQRIQAVAPLIRDTIRDNRSSPTSTASKQGWHAEAIVEILTEERFRALTFRESHLGNCATITATKPLTSAWKP